MQNDTISIFATGIYEPLEVVNVEDIKTSEGIPEERIKKLGIERVRAAYNNEHPTGMAISAAKNAINSAGIDPKDIDIVVFCHGLLTDHLVWPDYAEIQKEIGAVNANSFRIYQGCNGQVMTLDYVYSKMIADKSINLVLIVSSDKFCKPIINRWRGSNTVFFGDGASAALIKRGSTGYLIEGINLTTDPTYNRIWQSTTKGGTILPFSPEVGLEEDEMLMDYVKSGGAYQTDENMRKLIVDSMISRNKKVLDSLLKKSDKDIEINKIVTLNMGINWIAQVAQTLDIPLEDTSAYLAKDYGHMGPCDLMFNLHKMNQDGKIKRGDNIVLFSSGAGYSVGCALIKYL